MNYINYTWNSFPFIRLTPLFLIGILISDIFGTSFLPWYLGIPFFLFFLLCFWNRLRHIRIKRTYEKHAGILHLILVFLIGFTITNQYQLQHSSNDQDWSPLTVPYVQAELLENPIPTKKKIKVKCSIDQPNSKITTQAILYFNKVDSISIPVRGDIVLLKNKLSTFDPPKNPGEFNYKRFLKWKRIHFRQFVQSDDYKIIRHNKESIIERTVRISRNHVQRVILTVIKNDRERKVAHALFLGDKHVLDPEIRSAYAETGAMHVLAVSGLHVGIFYMMLKLLLSRIIRNKKIRYNIIRNSIILLFIWFYALLTGSSPSVMRAATMFSFIVVADTTGSKSNIFNTVAASAFILLLFKPLMLFEVGFQLSYLAVFGIVLFYPIFYNCLYVRNKWLDKIWQITCVSFAAQLATFPLGLLYFNQFPLIFPLSNLFVIPLIGIIIHVGIATIAFSWIPVALKFVGSILNTVITLLNNGVFKFEKIPNALLENIHVSTFKIILIYGLIISLFVLYRFPRTKSLLACLTISCGLCLNVFIQKINNQKDNFIVVFNENQTTTLGFSSSNSAMVISHTPYNENKKYNVKTFFLSKHKTPNYEIFDSVYHQSNNFMEFNNKSIIRIDKKFKLIESARLSSHVLLISDSQPHSINKILHSIKSEYLVFDSSNSKWKLNEWKATCDSLQVGYHDVNEQGAFVLMF